MKFLRQILRGLGMVSLLFIGLAVLLFLFPFNDAAGKQAWIKRWSNWIAGMLGLHLTVTGTPNANALIVANHSSWLDIVVIDSVQPAAFIAKAEIARWPVVGLLVARSGTLFIERGKRSAVHAVLQDAVARLKAGSCVAVFPEGTTNDGKSLLPFHGNLMEAAIRGKVLVQPLAISYRNGRGELCPSVSFVGQTTFVGSLFRVLADSDIRVHVEVLETQISVGSTRHTLATDARLAIAKALDLPLDSTDRFAINAATK
jgi:1-acyl-sn-glycerol-3-phosphate acyltransferase